MDMKLYGNYMEMEKRPSEIKNMAILKGGSPMGNTRVKAFNHTHLLNEG